MAKKKYFTSWDEMIVGIRDDLTEYFDEVCEELCQELNEMVDVYIYINKPESENYDRTYEMSDGIVSWKKLGATNAEFYFNQKPIVTIDNPYHHALEEGATMDEMFDLASWGRLEDMRAYIVKRFPQLYRAKLYGKKS